MKLSEAGSIVGKSKIEEKYRAPIYFLNNVSGSFYLLFATGLATVSKSLEFTIEFSNGSRFFFDKPLPVV